MAKDGTYRGGRRVKAGSKPDALADKIMKGAPAKRMELPDFTEDMTDFDVDDIGDGVELEGMDMPSPDDYLSALQKDGKPLGADEIYKETWLWLKERGCERLVNKRLLESYSEAFAGTFSAPKRSANTACSESTRPPALPLRALSHSF